MSAPVSIQLYTPRDAIDRDLRGALVSIAELQKRLSASGRTL